MWIEYRELRADLCLPMAQAIAHFIYLVWLAGGQVLLLADIGSKVVWLDFDAYQRKRDDFPGRKSSPC